MKLSQLTPEQKTRLLAELDGFEVRQVDYKTYAIFQNETLKSGDFDEEEYAWNASEELC